jgi:hypothetical protein
LRANSVMDAQPDAGAKMLANEMVLLLFLVWHASRHSLLAVPMARALLSNRLTRLQGALL